MIHKFTDCILIRSRIVAGRVVGKGSTSSLGICTGVIDTKLGPTRVEVHWANGHTTLEYIGRLTDFSRYLYYLEQEVGELHNKRQTLAARLGVSVLTDYTPSP